MEIQSAEFVRGIKGTDPILNSGLPQIAFVGRSNVGKSSTLNALLNRKDLVAVSKKPGKTTEINFFLVNEKIYFVDLPGYGYARAGSKKREKIKKLIVWYLTSGEARPATREPGERSHDSAKASLDCVLYTNHKVLGQNWSSRRMPALVALITDIQAGFTDFDKEMLRIIQEQGYPYVVVANKIDKLNQKEIARELLKMKNESNGIEIFPHSAKTKKGMDILREKLLDSCK